MIMTSFPTRTEQHECLRPTDRLTADLPAYGDHEHRTGSRRHRRPQLLHDLWNRTSQRTVRACRLDGEQAIRQGLSAKAADIPVGSGKIFPDAQTVITQPKEGEFKAFSSICTHQACPVATVTDTINCDCHGSKYSITDGSVVNPPAPNPLPAKTIKVEGDTLTVTSSWPDRHPKRSSR